MAEVDGKVIMRSREGDLYQVAPEDVASAARDQGWHVAPDDVVQKRIEERAQYSRYGSTGQQALGALETGVRTATFGAVPGFGSPEDIAGRSQVLREQSPVANFLAQAAGAAVPALVTGAVGGALAEGTEGASLAARLLSGAPAEEAVPAARLAGQVARGGVATAEGLSGSTAAEVEQARQENRPVSAGNILMYDVGGELLGRAVPALVREGAAGLRERLLSQAGESAATASEGVLAGAERRALESSADVADGVPVGPDRDTFLAGAHRQIIDTATERATGSLDQLQADMREVSGGAGVRERKVDRLVAKTNDAQRQWAADASQGALDLREDLRPTPTRAAPREAPLETPAVPDALPADSGAPGGATAPVTRTDYAAAGLGKFTRDLSETLASGSKALDEASEGSAWFRAANELHGQLGAVEQKLERYAASASAQDPAATEELLGKVRDYRNTLRQGAEREDLWGDAARYQRGLNQATADGWQAGARVVEKDLGRSVGAPQGGISDVRYDPSKVRAHLSADAIDRGITPEFLEKQLSGAERAIATHEEFGTASKETLARMKADVANIREQLTLADDVRGAKARVADREGARAESERVLRQRAKDRERETAGAVREQKAAADAKARADQEKSDAMSQLLGVAVGAAAHSVGAGAVVAVGTKLLRMRQLVDTLGRAGEATIGSAAKGAIYGRATRALTRIEQGASTVAGSKATVPLLQTAMARFQGDYPSIQTAFDAKRRAIDSVMQNPLLLHRAIAQHLGPMGKVAPDTYGQVAARMQAAVQYLHDNLPSQLSASMVRPGGIPLSRATARDFALKWNSAMNPASVLEDVRDGRASPTQLRTLAAVHPDIYQDLHLELVRQVSQNPGAMTTQRKLRLDILFDSDGIAGRAFSWPLATAIKSMHQQQGPATGALAGAKATTAAMGKSTPSRGLSNIKGSVTNAA